MRVSAKAEYACIATIELAANYATLQPVRIRAIAAAHGIPQRFLVQILLQLQAAGLVSSVRGAAGGYQLARPPEQIRLADVISAIDRTTETQARRGKLVSSAAVRALENTWREIQAAEQRLLAGLTMADLVRRAQESGELSYQI